jgi:hypothetical protein
MYVFMKKEDYNCNITNALFRETSSSKGVRVLSSIHTISLTITFTLMHPACSIHKLVAGLMKGSYLLRDLVIRMVWTY